MLICFFNKFPLITLKSKSDKHLELYTEIKEKVTERKKLKAELDKIPKSQIFKRSELMGKINTLSEQIEYLKSEKSILLDELGCADDKDNFSRDTFKESIRITDNDLHEDLYSEHSSIICKLKAYKQQQQEQTYPKPKHKEPDDEMEL